MSVSHSRASGPDVDPPDVGWVAAVGVYTGIVLAGSSVAVAVAAGVSGATILGAVSTVFTMGLVVGALGAERTPELAERVGSGLPWLATPFLAPAGFGIATAVVLATPVAAGAAVGTGVGAVLSGFVGLALAGMARTRYARTMTAGDPLTTVPRLWSQPRYTAGWGVACFGLVGALAAVQSGPLVGRVSWHLLLLGTLSLLMAWSTHVGLRQRADGETEAVTPSGWRRLLPHHVTARRSILGHEMGLSQEFSLDPAGTNELEIHPEGLVLTQPLQRRFVPWTAIADVTRTETELRFERDGWLDLRLPTVLLDDTEAVVETIRRARAGADSPEGDRPVESVE